MRPWKRHPTSPPQVQEWNGLQVHRWTLLELGTSVLSHTDHLLNLRLGPSTRCVDSTRQATVELHDPSPAPLQFSPALADIDSGHLSSVPVPSIRQATQRTHCLTETVSPIRFPIFTFSNSASIGQSLRVNRTQCLLASQGPSLAL